MCTTGVFFFCCLIARYSRKCSSDVNDPFIQVFMSIFSLSFFIELYKVENILLALK